MNKIAQYLNEHLLGEVSSDELTRQKFSVDGSILNITPDYVVHPRVTNDMRKVARFAWQLAEKGHVLPITIRGGGSNRTGAAIGKGIIVNTYAHLNKTIFISFKNKDQFVHVQPGVNFKALNDTLKSHGFIIPAYPKTSAYSSIGGAVANNAGGMQSGRFGQTGEWVKRLEVVLANGDLIETTRISKHDLNKKKGLQTFEGEIYRKIDGIIEDNQQVIYDKIANNEPDNTGYPGISMVKARDGSFDLSPLIIGSQGTLALISEIVMRTDFYTDAETIITATFDNSEVARDCADALAALQPTVLELIDGEMFDIAHKCGKKYIFSDEYAEKSVGAVMFVDFNDSNDHLRRKKEKQALKRLSKFETTIYTSSDYSKEELYAVREVGSVILESNTKGESMPSIIDGVSIPAARREEFILAAKELASKHHIDLPLHIQWLDGVIYTRPTMDLHIVSDKQKTFKLISDYIELVAKYGGSMAADSGEGRLRANAAYALLDDDELDVYTQIKEAFDPFGILNPGVKQKSELKTMIAALNPDYSSAEFAQFSPSE
ncbi:MAG: FAD-binding oxidoreductase [Candidatus Saccharibacteria bacterium]|nr:FAD-binding oxidoreductase [Candidatus Saccharibacteria bacterium]